MGCCHSKDDSSTNEPLMNAMGEAGRGRAASGGTCSSVLSFTHLVRAALEQVPPASFPDAAAMLRDQPDTVVLDVRGTGEAADERVAGAINVPRGLLEFKATVGFPGGHENALANRNVNVLTYCASGGRAALAAQTLRGMGFRNARSMGSLAAWKAAGGRVWKTGDAAPADVLRSNVNHRTPPPPIDGSAARLVTCGTLVDAAKKAVAVLGYDAAQQAAAAAGTAVLDVREPAEVEASGIIAGAINIPRGLIEFKASADFPGGQHPALANRGVCVLTYCASGGRAALAAQTLRGMGFTAKVMPAFTDWVTAGGIIMPMPNGRRTTFGKRSHDSK